MLTTKKNHPIVRFTVCSFAVLLLLCGSVEAQQSQPPTLLLISLDGFRYDYPEKAPTPNIHFLVSRGVRSEGMIPSFPTKTFPNHYTIATGLYPEHQGIVSNNIWDSSFDATFHMSNRDEVRNGRWWLGQPIWVTAGKQGLKTATLYWPGSEAEIQGYRPDYWEPYDKNTSALERVDKILAWLDLPPQKRPIFLTLYLEDADNAGHKFGPDSPQVVTAIRTIDEAIGHLLSGLRDRHLLDTMNIVIVADHGMAAIPKSHMVFLDDYLDPHSFLTLDLSPFFSGHATNGDSVALLEKLQKVPHLSVYLKEQTPARWHYNHSSRIEPVVGVIDEGWMLTTHEELAKKPDLYEPGSHGFDNSLSSMQAIFIAEGPAFKRHVTLPRFPNVDVYSLMVCLLRLGPAKTDGSPDVFLPSLVNGGSSCSRITPAQKGVVR